ncbi:MAG: RtcB family protein [Elusimicrobia bacterium]|nr:RtcB family protein [Elusimicrobiota bacterium]
MPDSRIKRLDANRLELSPSFKPGMFSGAVIYADETLEGLLEPEAIEQTANMATLPGIVGPAMAMPDIHTGYGFPIGGVAAFDAADGVISPGGVGYDINCGVRLLRTNLKRSEVSPKIKELVDLLYARIPLGVGSEGQIRLNSKDEKEILLKGSLWAVQNGYGLKADLECTESGGTLDGADPSVISRRAYERGRRQQGTLGSGNHFLEVQYVDEIYDAGTAEKLGLFKDRITVMIHTGSRGFGHQVCTDFIDVLRRAAARYKIKLADGQLAAAPFRSVEGQDYFGAMKAAANYAWANRQALTHWTRKAFSELFGRSERDLDMALIYDVAHNIAKLEEHTVNGVKKQVLVHRKGATRAFAPGHPDIPLQYREFGQPVIIPGDMGRYSYLLCGTRKAMNETFGSACHGAGRLMSRHEAIRRAGGRSITEELAKKGVIVRAAGRSTLAEEMPQAYKDVENVISVMTGAGIAGKVARFRPMGVIKG